MCGICGRLNLDDAPVARETIAAMCASLRHRGPDAEGTFVQGRIGLGHRRLTILDLTDAGNQPMSSPDGSHFIVFNGEIYNYRELRAELETKGESFRSTSDTEVLLRLYQRLGPACLAKLQGMFAVAIWDVAARTLFLARDRTGIKPLYYYVDARRLVFASEIKALLECADVPRAINHRAANVYFTFGHSFAPETIYAGIRKVLPGHWLLCRDGQVSVQKYWDVPDAPLLDIDEHEAAREVHRLLQQAVTSHMVSDVPVGAFLSGGIDSSATVAFMAAASSAPVKTFSVGFDVGGFYNELEDARVVARLFHTEHHEKIVKEVHVEGLLEQLVYHYDEPFADAANLPTYIVSEFAREHVKVVLSGEGSDEIFGGYRRYIAHTSAAFRYLGRAFALAAYVPAFGRYGLREFRRRARRIAESARIAQDDLRYASWLTCFHQDLKAELLQGVTTSADDAHDAYGAYYNHHPHWEPLNRCLYTDLKGWLPDTYLEKVDKASMAVGLEGRVPFLDHRLVEFAFRLPAKFKLRGRRTKYILKKSLEGVLPHSTLYKPKHGFTVPLDEWFRGRLKGMAEDVLLSSGTRASGFLRPEAVEGLIREHVRGERDCGLQLWTLMNFELWYRRYMHATERASVIGAGDRIS